MSDNDRYGFFREGLEIPKAPMGWKLLPQNSKIPQMHREFQEQYMVSTGQWLGARRCHSTMTPMWACIWGSVRAFAVLEDHKIEPYNFNH